MKQSNLINSRIVNNIGKSSFRREIFETAVHVMLQAVGYSIYLFISERNFTGTYRKPNVDKPQPNRNDLTLKQRDASHQASESS